MSFCRFSDDDYQSDFYAYETVHGYELHVAASRVEWHPPFSPMTREALELPAERWAELYQAYMERLEAAPRHPIQHPDAGRHYIFTSLAELRDRIRELSQQGLHAPSWLLPELEREISNNARSEGNEHGRNA